MAYDNALERQCHWVIGWVFTRLDYHNLYEENDHLSLVWKMKYSSSVIFGASNIRIDAQGSSDPNVEVQKNERLLLFLAERNGHTTALSYLQSYHGN